jgi:glycine C-acetyltransferase
MVMTVRAELNAELDAIRSAGLNKNERVLSSPQAAHIRVGGSPEVLNLCANNYLGLANHPALVEVAKAALDRWGYGLSSVRFICGTQEIHKELEASISTFLGTEDTILYSSCFDANGGLFETLLNEEDTVISDELNHASIIDGARLSRATIKVFRHKDTAHAEELLKEVAGEPGHKLIITDGVFSMDGDVGPLPALCDLAEKYGAIMMVDDAHASGVLGRNGRGTIDHFNVHGRVDVQVGTLSKAIGALGGYVCGSRELIDFLYHRARPFLFSTSHPPSVAATCIAAFEVLEQEPQLMEKLWENTRFFKKELGNLGFNIGGKNTPVSETPITPIIVGEGRVAMEFSRELFDEGVFTPGIAFPTVAEGKARLRTIMTATHTKDQLSKSLEVLKKVGSKMGIIS